MGQKATWRGNKEVEIIEKGDEYSKIKDPFGDTVTAHNSNLEVKN